MQEGDGGAGGGWVASKATALHQHLRQANISSKAIAVSIGGVTPWPPEAGLVESRVGI